MKRLSIFPALLLSVGLVCAQDKPAETAPKPEVYEAAIIPVKVLTGDSFDRLVKLVGVFGVRYVADDKLRTIVVYAPKDLAAQVRKFVEQLDQPGSEAAIGRNIDMTLSFLRCSTKTPAQPSALPADLEPVARQLRAVTQYKDIELWDTVPLRVQEGKDTDESFRLPSGEASELKNVPTIGSLKIHPESVTRKDQGRYVRFSALRFSFRIPYVAAPPNQWSYMDVGLTTSGDFGEGQKTVLGKLSGLDDEAAVFVVISLKVLD